jgi:hypothetical protein
VCIFTLPVERIANTCLFARLNSHGEQYLAYSMSATLPQEMAMILPLPVRQDIPDPLSFIDLSGCSLFFSYIEESFKGPRSRGSRSSLSTAPTLEVLSVGSFEASYVPRQEDFGRLDQRFRLDAKLWSQLPRYLDYSFAVFKLKSGDHHFHPMALKFATRFPSQLFFPTVHVHDQTVPERERFDHKLYCQTEAHLPDPEWQASSYALGSIIPTHNHTQGILDRNKHGFRRVMDGEYANEDVLVEAAPLADPASEGKFFPGLSPELKRGLRRK